MKLPTHAVLVDIETRSAVDLRKEGGRRYAEHPSTEVLTVSWYDTETHREYLWIPRMTEAHRDQPAVAGLLRTHLGNEYVTLYVGQEFPAPLAALAASDRPFVAHNAWGFDSLVWAAKYPDHKPAYWIDTDPLARAVGLPGGLDRIGKELRQGKGKHAEGRSRLKKFMGYKHEPKVGDLVLIGAYCWDDTCGLLRTLWEYLQTHQLAPFEQEVLAAHYEVNEAGVGFDLGLAAALKDLAGVAQQQALERCKVLSGGDKSPFQSEADLRKRDKVKDWILSVASTIPTGLTTTTRKGDVVEVKFTLRKEVVENLLKAMEAEDANNDTEDDEVSDGPGEDQLEAGDEEDRIPPVVVEFLKARFACLRITRGKIDAAIKRVSGGRLRDLLVYYGAHTGRFAGRGLQIQNLPRPAEGVPVWNWKVEDKGTKTVHGKGLGLISLYERDGKLDPDAVQEILDAHYAASSLLEPDPKKRHKKPTLDDAAAALIRGTLVPDDYGSEVFPVLKDRFSAGDYNAIELRGAGWFADVDAIMEFFRKGIDPYCTMAEQIYGRPCRNKKDPIRQVGKVVMLGSQYQMGATKLTVYAASLGVNLEDAGTTPQKCTTAFRDLFPGLAGERTGDYTDDNQPIRKGGIWADLQAAALKAGEVNGPKAAKAGKAVFRRVGTDLHMVLPSGRPIIYRNAKVEDVIPSWEKGKKNPKLRQAVVYTSPRGFRNTLYGGKLLENAVQAISRDILVDAMVRCIKEGLRVRFHVHDELVVSARTSEEGHRAMQIMSTPPSWALDFPLLVEADTMPRYAKTAPPGYESYNYENGRLKK